MGRQNIVFLYGRILKPPINQRNRETGESLYCMVYIDTVRGLREIDDGVKFVKHDNPLVLSREKEIIDRMSEWKENDIVLIKGVITSKSLPKSSFCPNCKDENGNPVRNDVKGNLVYITPIYVEKIKEFDNPESAIEDLIAHREISNQAYVVGTLIRDPRFITTKKGIQICQYPIAINRKFTIRTDDPSIRTDWPIVKSYGEQAREDRIYLQYQADVLIDGFLQARALTRKVKCSCCGNIYEYKDQAMELVPYDVEYIRGHKTKESVELENKLTVEAIKQKLFHSSIKDNDELEEDLKSDDVVD